MAEQLTANQALQTYNILESNKFGTITFEIVFAQIIDKKTVAARNIVAKLLTKVLANYPTKLATRAYFADLYAAKVQSGVQKNGGLHEIIFQFTFINPKMINDDKYTLDSIFACIEQIILQPFLENGAFSETILQVECRMMQDRIRTLYDDKTQYAQLQLINHMFKGTPLAIKSYGEITDYDNLTATEVYQTYQKMLTIDLINVFCTGDVAAPIIEQRFRKIFQNLQKDAKYISPQVVGIEERAKVQEITETQDVNQTKLHLGYYAPTALTNENYLPHALANEVLGGGAQSKLFQNVREKASLAYYAVSGLDSYSNSLYVYAGIEAEKLTQATQIIDEQITALQNGEVTEEEFQIAKLNMLHRIDMLQDSQNGLIAIQKIIEKLAGVDSITDWQAAINKIEKADIIAAAKTWRKDTQFVLLPENSGKEVEK